MDDGANRSILARREFLKATGAVVVGFSMADTAAAQVSSASPTRRGVVSGPPDEGEIDSYIAVHPDTTVTIFSGYVDLGQGGPTALRQIAAEELDLDFDQVLTVRADTFLSTNGFTAASRTAGIGGTQLRAAAAEARRVLLIMASDRLKAAVQELTVAKGIVSVRTDPTRSTSYGELLGDKAFNRRYEPVSYTGGIELPRTSPDNAPPKARTEYKIVGARIPRPEMYDKVTGKYAYVQHVRVPGMLHGRLVWPRGQGPYGVSPKVIAIDEQSIRDIPGVKVVRRHNFVGVAAEREWDAVRAAKQLKVTWAPVPTMLPGDGSLHDSYRAAKTKDIVVTNTGNADAVLKQAAHVVTSTYRGPYESHGTMAPNCAVADVTQEGALVMCSDQGIYQIRPALAKLLSLPLEKIRVQYYPGSNTYGSSCYRESSPAAAIMSQELGKPVRLQLSREDEFGWDNYGPAHLADLRAAVDTNGKILAFEYQAWSHAGPAGATVEHLALGTEPLVADTATGVGLYQIRLSQNDMYDIPNRRLIDHRLSANGYLRIGPLRAPLDPPYFFAQEGMMDELAYAAKLDSYEFRKRNISHSRWLGVLKAATDAARWTPRPAASNISSGKIASGRGIALGTHHLPMNQGDRITYAAAVVEIEVNKETGAIAVKHVFGAMDCGLAINPGIVESQIVGMAIHGTSLALKEEVHFNQTNVTSLDWSTYQTLRFAEHPPVTPTVVQQIHEKSSGAGEEVLPAVVAAIGNAFFDATGVRLREFPLTPRRVQTALKAGTSSRSV